MHHSTVIAKVMGRARALFRRATVEREMAEEMAAHLAFEIEDRMRQGMTAREARRTALRDFGGVERFKDEARAARGVQLIHDLVQDGVYAIRVLRQSFGFTVTSVLTVAVGIGVATGISSVANTVLFRQPPVSAPDRLVIVAEVWKSGERSWQTSMRQYMYGYDHYRDLRDASGRVFDGLAGFRYGSVALRVGDEARPVSCLLVSANYFDVLGLHPAAGRFFDVEQVEHGEASAAVVSHDFWIRALAGDPSAIGKAIMVDGKPFTVVGIAPSGFTGTSLGLGADLWLPTTEGSFTMIGRLAAGVSHDRAVAELTAMIRASPVTSLRID